MGVKPGSARPETLREEYIIKVDSGVYPALYGPITLLTAAG